MNEKIIGVTVGTPISPSKIEDKLKPVKTVNGVEPDENGNVEVSGNNGTSVTVTEIIESTEDGGSNTVTFSDGNALTVKNGKTGKDGYNPVRGTDYWTDEDKEEIVTEVEKYVDEQLNGIEVTVGASLPEYVEALSEDLDTSKKYVLPDGWVYEYKEGENVIYNYAADMEINRKLRDGITSNAHGYVTTPFIPITWEDPYVVRVYSDNLYNESVNKALYIEGYDADENMIGSLSFGLNNYSNGVIQVELNESAFIDGAPSLLRICIRLSQYELENEEDLVKNLFIELPAEGTSGTPSGWEKTELRFVPKDYEERLFGGYKLIREVVIPNDITTDTSGVAFAYATKGNANNGVIFAFDTDADGNSFEYSELIIISYASTPHSVASFAIGNSNIPQAHSTNLLPLRLVLGTGGSNIGAYCHGIKLGKDQVVCYATWGNPYLGNGNLEYGRATGLSNTEGTFNAICGFMNEHIGYGFTPGSVFKFYAR